MRRTVAIKREGLPDLEVTANYTNDPGDLECPPDIGWEILSVTADGEDVEHTLDESDYEHIYWKLNRLLPLREDE